MKASIALLAVVSLILLSTFAEARIGDNTARTLLRYGKVASSTSVAGKLTSTKTFQVNELMITCGYVNDVVQMITYRRPDRSFQPPETQIVLRTNSRREPWLPANLGFGNGSYHTTTGLVASVKDNIIEIHTPAWQDAIDTDNGVKKAPAAPAAATGTAPTPASPAPAATTTAPPVSSTTAPAPVPSTAPATPSTAPNP